MKKFSIGNISVGGERVLVIPEIGINHNGNLEVAKAMVDAAFRAGARLIKHQTHVVEDEMSKSAKNVIPGNSNISIFDIMKDCALDEIEEYDLMQYTESLGLEFLSTPFSRAAANRLEKFGVKAYKIGSGELNNYPLIEHIAEFGKPMIMSTGMNSIRDIDIAVNILEKYGTPYALMHTTNLYPTKPEMVRFGAMTEMMRAFSEIPIGLSDHTLNNNACIGAIALGAKIVERHFTDTMNRTGPDIVCSMDENKLRELLLAAIEVPMMQGGDKKPLKEEKVTIDFAFATVVSIKKIKRGEMFTEDNIWVKRPGIGEIRAVDYKKILGKIAKCDIEMDEHIGWSMVE